MEPSLAVTPVPPLGATVPANIEIAPPFVPVCVIVSAGPLTTFAGMLSAPRVVLIAAAPGVPVTEVPPVIVTVPPTPAPRAAPPVRDSAPPAPVVFPAPA